MGGPMYNNDFEWKWNLHVKHFECLEVQTNHNDISYEKSFAYLLRTLHGCNIFLVLHGCCSCILQAHVKPTFKGWKSKNYSICRNWSELIKQIWMSEKIPFLRCTTNNTFIILSNHVKDWVRHDWPAHCLAHAFLVCHTPSFHLLSVTILHTGNF